jgi:signal transduction histidine kinase/ActR/RegA family two-component response regulator
VRYAVVAVAVLLATLLRLSFAAALGDGVPFIFYFPAVVVCAWFGGLWPGLVATAFSALAAAYAFMPPHHAFALHSATSVVQLLLFLVAGALIGLLAESLHRARRLAEERPRRAYEDARKRQREAESLAAVVRTLNTLDVGAVLQSVVESACGLLDADLATVFRLDPTGNSLSLVAAGGPRGTVLERNVSLPRGSSLVWLAIEQRATVTSPDLLADQRFTYPPAMRAGIEAARHRAGLAAPLVAQGRIIGALFVGVLPGRVFSADDVRVVTAFADHAAAAMANAELYHDAQRANRAKDEFLAMLGHELRNPLGAIAGASGVLKATGGGDATGERARAVIDRQVQHLARLVDDLLDVGRLTTGKVRLNRRPLELGELVSGAMSAWCSSGRFARHDVRIDVSPVWVDADETRMEQVLGNLVGNALKYTPPAGRVTVRVAADGDSAALEVADTGAGIPIDIGDRIFDLFVQGERPLDRAQGGLGIGLTLVKALVALHGGTVGARSEGPGRGSVFTVRLPAVPAPPAGSSPSSATSRVATPRRILVVEDNADAREMLRTQLTLAGHEVHEAADGPAGVDAAATLSPDVALVDVGLPGLDGYEVARRIRAVANGRSLVLIAITGYGQAEDRLRAEEAGFDAHLTKPLLPERLAAAMDEAASRRGLAGRG